MFSVLSIERDVFTSLYFLKCPKKFLKAYLIIYNYTSSKERKYDKGKLNLIIYLRCQKKLL